jgi:signal transduction histidine kinase
MFSGSNELTAVIKAIEQLKDHIYTLDLPPVEGTAGEISALATSVTDLARALQDRDEEQRKLEKITTAVSTGLMLEDILEAVYRDFHEIIPYNRIGLSLIHKDEDRVVARWAKSDLPEMLLGEGYSASLRGSSLERIISTRRPRILNDLAAYLSRNPESHSTRLIVEEGLLSSLTCPLLIDDAAVGFLFFSSRNKNTYANVHVEVFQSIARHVSVMVQKGRLVSKITSQKAEIERQNDDLKRLNEQKNTFLGIAAHDVRSPVGMAKVIGERLRQRGHEMSREEMEFLLDYMIRQTTHALHLLDNLLDTSQIESGRLSLRREKVDVREFLEEAVHRHDTLAAPKSTRVVLATLQGDGVAVADPFRLRQVLDNLISNAVKYSPPGSTVRVVAHRKSDGWEIRVIDQGPGLSPADQARLFRYFERLSAQPTGGEKSSGLGLAISQRIVHAHGGEIGVVSDEGKGAEFWFSLPDRRNGP